ncbi:DUF4276 family protein [Stigmatella sp. ncwal1]|uniref:DUF4276 family protein n=1 Tax=Stigmatella ashevillensis TaxID=2995309 RepID=A0ABT5DD40_9BACT|nr:DUF4276 family protein [Stigmatella ashevillena]MDC0711577.1 DUF4276 family protein [Stigmatella ashevillena]
MKVLVYVEGPGDRASLEMLFREVRQQGRQSKVSITFHHTGGKDWILRYLGKTVASELKSSPDNYVFALPDLYPMAKYDRTLEVHHSFGELRALLWKRFMEEADREGLPEAVRSHYRIHCLKHDLEVLLLGAPDILKQRLNTDEGIEKQWRKPPEDQNDQKPPKRVVEQLFMKYRRRAYIETTDAPWILERASARELCAACPQNFKPLFHELERLSRGEHLE